MKILIGLVLFIFLSGCVEPTTNPKPTTISNVLTPQPTPIKYDDIDFIGWYSAWMKTVDDNNTRLSSVMNSHGEVQNVMMFGESWFDITNRNYRILHGYKVSSPLKPTYDEIEQAIIEEQQRGQALEQYKVEYAERLNGGIKEHYKLAEMYLNEYSAWKARVAQ